MSALRRGVPVRALLGGVLLLLVALPAVVTVGVHLALQAVDRPGPADLLTARAFLAGGVTSWDDPGWRSAARVYLASLGVDAAVQPAGRPEVPLAGADQSAPTVTRDKFVVRDPSGVVLGSGWVAVGHLSRTPGWGEPAAAGAAALLIVLAVVAILVGRAIVRPLAALSSAAGAIADGDFDIRLPASPVREVGDAVTAVEGMGARLASALQHQADLEQERRIFVGAVAHDLRTPIFTLRAYLDGLRDGLAVEPERAMRYVEVCQRKVAAVDNLLDNAARYTPAGGRIHVGWRKDGDRVTFVVEDSGPGIASQDLPHVFEPLFRGESSRNRGTGGAGLGLSIAQRIVRAHGGELSAANSAEGHARFTAWLPAGGAPTARLLRAVRP